MRLKSRGNFSVAESLFAATTRNREEEEEDILRSQSEEREGKREIKGNAIQRNEPPSLPRRRIISYKFVPPHLKTRGWVHTAQHFRRHHRPRHRGALIQGARGDSLSLLSEFTTELILQCLTVSHDLSEYGLLSGARPAVGKHIFCPLFVATCITEQRIQWDDRRRTRRGGSARPRRPSRSHRTQFKGGQQTD